MNKFNLKGGLNQIKKEAKKLPKNTAKQLPNAAAILAGGGIGAMVGKGAMKMMGTSAAKKAGGGFKKAVFGGSKKPKIKSQTMDRKYDQQLRHDWGKKGYDVVGDRLKKRMKK